jgi:NAD(P)-dependent dehydrogenase (short-subunit alcohol dehydrogenase family)
LDSAAGAPSGLGQEAARLLAEEGWREIIVTGRTLAKAKQTAAKLAADTKLNVFTPLELDLDSPSSVQSALAELVKRGRPVDFLLLNAGVVPGKKRVLTAAGIEASQAPLIGNHQLTVGLLGDKLLSPDARIVIAGAEPARGDVPLFKLSNVTALATTSYQTNPWGITVQSVEIRDMRIPQGLEDAMSRQAQAERERQARIILRQAETDIAEKFSQAAFMYQNNPVALHLRAMNMLYEAIKEKGAMVIVPSSAVENDGVGRNVGDYFIGWYETIVSQCSYGIAVVVGVAEK